MCSTQLEEARPASAGASGDWHLRPAGAAVSKTEVLLGVSEERLDAPSHRVQLDEMARWCVDFVRHDVLHARFVVLVVLLGGFFLCDQQLHCTEAPNFTLLRPDMVGVAVNRPGNRVDALAKRVDTDAFSTVRDARVTLDRGNHSLP